MKIKYFCFLLLFSSANLARGQQDPMFTKYMFNSLIFNPGYAGSKDHLSLALLHRSQWQELEGAPVTQTLTAHTPLRNERVGVGLSLANDIIGPTRSTGANLAYSYRIPFKKFKICFGLQAGFDSYRSDFSELVLDMSDDPSFINASKVLPNVGAGLYIYSKHFYFGASSPRLIEHDLQQDVEMGIFARQARHYYLTMGAAIPLKGDAIIFKPSILLKNAGLDRRVFPGGQYVNYGAPDEFDFDFSLLFQETLWVGASFRSAFSAPALSLNPKSSYDSADFWVSFLFKNGLRIGAAYDYTVSDLSTVTNGAFEVMFGYEFNFREKRVVTPRYF